MEISAPRHVQPVATGDWSEDCRKGRTFARDIVTLMQETNNPGLLTFVIEDLEKTEAVYVGFCGEIAARLIEG